MNLIVVVPDEFENLSKRPGLLRYCVLIEKLRTNDTSELVGMSMIAGQGLSEMEIDHAFCLAASVGLSVEFSHWRQWHSDARASRSLSHKHRTENVLISTPRRADGTDHYTAALMIDVRSELMSDHLTGLHIQGMVLTEACRQMFLAVTERFCLDDFPAGKRYFVISHMAMRYMEFAFPLPAEIRYHQLEQQQPKPDRMSIKADMEVWQNDRPVAGMAVEFTVFDAKYLSEREATLADRALAQCLHTTAAAVAARNARTIVDTASMREEELEEVLQS